MLRSAEELPGELRQSEAGVETVQEELSRSTPELQRYVPEDGALYRAMEFFLLLNPEEQALRLGEPDALKLSADEAKASGNHLLARINYESAAKIALFRQNRTQFTSMVSLADQVTPADQEFAALHRTLLRETDAAMRVARDYYGELTRLRRSAGLVQTERGATSLLVAR